MLEHLEDIIEPLGSSEGDTSGEAEDGSEEQQQQQEGSSDQSDESTTQSDGTLGDTRDTRYGDVQYSATSCAVVAAGSVIHAMTGENIPEDVLIDVAEKNGLYRNGTLPENFGKLLGVYNIPFHVNENGTMQNIAEELAYGNKVLVNIDGPELWGKELGGWLGEVFDWLEENLGRGGNHAVWITSINNVNAPNPENITVTLNDSGQSDGVGKTYSLGEFIDAAKDSNFHYVATGEAAPGTVQHSGPDPDLVAFPGIKDYYETQYGESLVANGAGVESAPTGVIASQSEFDIEQMSLNVNNKVFFVKETYPLETWLADRAVESKVSLSIEDAQKLIGPNYHDVPIEYREWFSDTYQGPVGAQNAYQEWIFEKFNEANSVGEVRTLLAELGHETQIHTGATYEEAIAHVQSTGTQKLMAVDADELKLGDEPLHHVFWAKFKEVMGIARSNGSLGVVLLVPAVVSGIAEMVEAGFDLDGDTPDGLVRAEFGDDSVNVTWPNGEVESYSHGAFKEAFEDSRFSYISH